MAPLFLKNEEKRDNLKVINPFLRSAAYKKLSSLFTYPENNESYRQFRDEKREIKDIFAELSTEYDIDFQDDVDSLTSAVDGLSLQDIQVEYVRLFDYRPKCLIVESAYIYRRDKSTDPEKCASVRDGVEDFTADLDWKPAAGLNSSRPPVGGIRVYALPNSPGGYA